MPVQIYSARWSNATVTTKAGMEPVGVQALEYRINLNKQDHYESNDHLRKYVTYGYKQVGGSITVKSASQKLDELLDKPEEANNSFALHVELSDGTNKKILDFQECFLEGKNFGIDVNGNGVATYAFTAKDVKEGAA
jgi:hypothetical protein